MLPDIIETKRLILTPALYQAADDLWENVFRNAYMEYQTYKFECGEELWVYLRKLQYDYDTGSTYAWTINTDNVPVGLISCVNGDIGCTIGNAFQNQGICTDAFKAVMHYMEHKVMYITACCHEKNGASRRVLAKVGMRVYKRGMKTYISGPGLTKYYISI